MSADCLFLFLTEGCDLACRHCYVSASPGRHNRMGWETFERALDLANQLGIGDVRLTGGEPTYHPDFLAIADRVLTSGFTLGLTTNGKRLLGDTALEPLIPSLSRCWISAYGLTDASHLLIAGATGAPLEELIAWSGQKTHSVNVGLSVLLTPGSSCEVGTFLDRVADAGVCRVRFIPVQPDGRAAHVNRFDWTGWPDEVRQIHAFLNVQNCWGGAFTHLSLNNPFDIEQEFAKPAASCLIRQRGMWSVVPDGRVYPCCYTVYEDRQEVGRLGDDNLAHSLVLRDPMLYAARCRGLRSDYWPGSVVTKCSCPISAIQLLGLKEGATRQDGKQDRIDKE